MTTQSAMAPSGETASDLRRGIVLDDGYCLAPVSTTEIASTFV